MREDRERIVGGLLVLSVTWLAVVSSMVAMVAQGALAARSPRPPSAPRPAALAAPVFMLVGDSITQGSAGDFTWRYRLHTHLAATMTPVGSRVEFAGPRRDLYDLADHRHGNQDYADAKFDPDHNAIWGRLLADARAGIAADVAEFRPTHLLVLLGINDVMTGAEPATVEAHLRQFVANARAARPDLAIVLGTVLPTVRAQTDSVVGGRVTEVNARLPAIAAALHTDSSPVVVADTAAGIDTTADLYDGVHPNARGEVKIAAAYADTLAARFGLGSPYPRPLPDVPAGPSVAPVLTGTPGNGSARLAWTGSPGATGYWVWRRQVDTNGSAFERLPTPLAAADRQWTQAPLTNGVTYEYQVQPAKFASDGAMSNVVRLTPDASLPPAPR